MSIHYGDFWGLYGRLKEGSSALVLTCSELGLLPEKLFSQDCVVLQNLGAYAEPFGIGQISLAAQRAQTGAGPLDVVVFTHEGCPFLNGTPTLDHAHAQIVQLASHPGLSSARFHACLLDGEGTFRVGDFQARQWVTPVSLAQSLAEQENPRETSVASKTP